MPVTQKRGSLACLGISAFAALFVAGCSNGPEAAAEQPAVADSAVSEATLYERLGGTAPISVVVSDFLDAMVPDEFMNRNPAIAEARDRVPTAFLKYHVTAMVCQATGGPCTYTGRSMYDSHIKLNITEAEWDRMVVIFKGVLAKHNVPAREQRDLLAIIATTKGDIVTGG